MGKMVKPRILILLLFIFLLISFFVLPKREKAKNSTNFIPAGSDVESLLQGVTIKGIGKNHVVWELISEKTTTKKGLSQVELFSPQLRCILKDNTSFFIKGSYGVYKEKENVVQLNNNISGHYQDIDLYSNKLQFFLKQNIIKFFHGIEIKNKQIKIIAKQGIFDLNKQIFTLKKDVRVFLL